MKLKNICLASIALIITACGGGGSSPAVVEAGKTITGQVVKGPVEGATVDLYLLTDSGSKSLVASTKSIANGQFDFTNSLSAGKVYLLESVGGTYVDEVSKQPATLSTKLRAVFVAPSTTAKITVSPLTELVLMDIDKSVVADKWLASNVATTSSKVAQALGVDSTTGMNYIDLANLTQAAAATATEADISFSFQISLFSGIVNEVKHRNTSATITDAFKSFYSIILEDNTDDSVGSIFGASLIRTVDSMPILSANGARASILNAAGFPSDASLVVFTGAESSGENTNAISSALYKYLLHPNDGGDDIGGNVVFNKRGAAISYAKYSNASRNSDYSHLGYGSVSDAYSDNDVAIGKWNHGYYYPRGVTANDSNTITISESLGWGLSYAAYVPAYNIPICGLQTMSIKKWTKSSVGSNNSFNNEQYSLNLLPQSKIAFIFVNGSIYFGYELYFITNTGETKLLKSVGGLSSPTLKLENGKLIHAGNYLESTAAYVDFNMALAGDGAKSSVLVFKSNVENENSLDVAATFASDVSFVNCQSPVFSKKSFN